MPSYLIPVHLNVDADDPFDAQRIAEQCDGAPLRDHDAYVSLGATQAPDAVDEASR